MTPDKKANELIEKFEHQTNSIVKDTVAIQCAIVAVDEILNERIDFREYASTYNNDRIFYWKEVKTELNKRL